METRSSPNKDSRGSAHVPGERSALRALVLFLGVALLIVAAVFERWKYAPRVDDASGPWELTGEKFVEPGSGRLVEVWYNRATGERDDREPQGGNPS